MGFRVAGLGFRVSGLGFRVSGLGFRVSGLGLGFGFWIRVRGLGFHQGSRGSAGLWGFGASSLEGSAGYSKGLWLEGFRVWAP